MQPLTGRREEVYNRIHRNLQITRLAMATRFVEGMPPVNVMLIGPQGTGKTEILEALSDGDRFRLQTDITQSGLQTAFFDARYNGLLGLLVQDFGTLVNKSKPVAQRMLSHLASAMAEGVNRIDQGGTHWRDYGGARLGLYGAMTEWDFSLHIGLLESNAFLSRLVPVLHSFSYAEDRVFRDLIRDGYVKMRGYRWFPPDLVPKKVHLEDGQYDGLVEELVGLVRRHCPAVYSAQRTYNVFETLLKGSARLRGDVTVTDEDANNLFHFRDVWELPPFIPVPKAGK
ncbi:MAG: hypothetical protein GY906_22940 [bacterium]|nr:hypothetical protein [bacterium]